MSQLSCALRFRGYQQHSRRQAVLSEACLKLSLWDPDYLVALCKDKMILKMGKQFYQEELLYD